MFDVGESGPPLPPNLITPFPLSPPLSNINVVASKSNVVDLMSIPPPPATLMDFMTVVLSLMVQAQLFYVLKNLQKNMVVIMLK